MTLAFLITSLVVVLVPGTGVVYTVATGLSAGRRASVAAAFGCTLGIIPAILASTLGLAALLNASAIAFQTLKYAGVAYLLYLAWKTLGDSGPMQIETGRREPRSALAIIRTGFLINILNPKLSVFFLAFLPQFIDPGSASPLAAMLGLSAVFMAMTFVIFVIYGAFASLIGEKFLKSETAMRWMRRATAATFAGFGLRLALSTR